MKDIVGKECRFVVPMKTTSGPDKYFIKEILHYSDGTREPNTRTIQGIKRPYWIVKPEHRNFYQKKEWIDEDLCDKYMCYQKDLLKELKMHTGISARTLKDVKSSPYIYGADILPESIIKRMYRTKYPDTISPYTVATLDSETDMVGKREETIITTVCFGDTGYIFVSKTWYKNTIDPESHIDKAIRKYLPAIIEHGKVEYIMTDNEFDTWVQTFKKLHTLKPDFVSLWNMMYDIEMCNQACKRANVDPKHLYSDPSLPTHEKSYWLKKGQEQKLSDSGKLTPIPWHRQWHTIITPASFYFVDAACMYSITRVAKGKIVGGMGLDNILKRELKTGKLEFAEADMYSGLRWHQYMQENYPSEYTAYALYDVLGLLDLDKKTKDLSNTIGVFSKDSPFDIYPSLPKRLSVTLDEFISKQGKVLGSVGNFDKQESLLPKHMQGLTSLKAEEWIALLPTDLVLDEGIKIIEEDPNMKTRWRAFVGDLDCISSYPSDIGACNISKETQYSEVSAYEGGDLIRLKWNHINLLTGHVGSYAYGVEILHTGTTDDWLAEYHAHKNKADVKKELPF